MNDNMSYGHEGQAPPEYAGPARPTADDLLRSLAEGQRVNQDTITGLAQAVTALLTTQAQASGPRQSTNGPKVKEPRTYDGDRSNGKLDDHIRDITNWTSFYDARGHWTNEREAVEQAATYLTGRMHRIYGLQNASLHTMGQYVEWLRNTFKDNNEQYHLRDDWQATVQGHRTVLEYASDLVYLAARIVPTKSDAEIKEHFRAGLSSRLQMKLAEHPEWDDLALNDFIGRADRQDQIEEAKDRVRYQSERRPDSRGRAYAIAGAPRRGGRRPSSATRRPRKGSEEWQAWCKDREACFECGNPGHIVRDCPQTTGTSAKKLQPRSSSPYPRKGKVDRSPRNRAFSRSPSAGRKPAQRKVSFEEAKDRV
jgi:Zinc knuckle